MCQQLNPKKQMVQATLHIPMPPTLIIGRVAWSQVVASSKCMFQNSQRVDCKHGIICICMFGDTKTRSKEWCEVHARSVVLQKSDEPKSKHLAYSGGIVWTSWLKASVLALIVVF